LDEGKSDTFSLWNGNSVGLSITNDDNVTESGGEVVSLGVLDMDDIEGTLMFLDGGDDTNSTNVVSTGKDDGGTNLELDNTGDGLALEVELKTRKINVCEITDIKKLTLTESLIWMSG